MSSRHCLLDILYSFLRRCSGGEDFADAELFELRDVFFGNGAADEDEDGVGVLLDGRLDDLLGGLVEARVDDLHPRVAQGAGDDLGPPVVTVEANLRDYYPYRARHSDSILTGAVIPRHRPGDLHLLISRRLSQRT